MAIKYIDSTSLFFRMLRGCHNSSSGLRMLVCCPQLARLAYIYSCYYWIHLCFIRGMFRSTYLKIHQTSTRFGVEHRHCAIPHCLPSQPGSLTLVHPKFAAFRVQSPNQLKATDPVILSQPEPCTINHASRLDECAGSADRVAN